MTSASDLLRDLAEPGDSPFMVREVANVSAGGTVDLLLGETTIDGIPCLDGYHTRAVGDVVLVLQLPIGWVVLGRLSAPPLITSQLKFTSAVQEG